MLLIVTDSTRRDFVSIYDGDKLADTPNLDALGKEGLVFDRAVPEAMPTVAVRRALLTGTRSFPFRDWKVAPKLPQFPGWSPIPPYKRIFTEFLDDAGIETAYVTDNPFLIGPRFERFRGTLGTSKSIFGQAEYQVWNRGVDKDKIASNAQIENYLLPALKGTEAEQRIKENIGYNSGREGDQLSGARTLKAGMEVLRQLKDKQPFFLGVDAFDPHEAWNTPEAFMLRFPHHEGVEPILPFKTPNSKIESLDVTQDQIDRVRELYAGELTYIDAWIGRLLNLLDELGLADRTVVYYLSDHGILLGEHDRLGKDGSMLGKEIHSVPYMIRHPDGKRSGETERLLRLDPRRGAHDPLVPGTDRAGEDGGRGPHGDVRGRRPARARPLDHRVLGKRRRGRRPLAPHRRQPGQGAPALRHGGGPRRGEGRGRGQPGRGRPAVGLRPRRRRRHDAGVREDARHNRLGATRPKAQVRCTI